MGTVMVMVMVTVSEKVPGWHLHHACSSKATHMSECVMVDEPCYGSLRTVQLSASHQSTALWR